MSTNIQIFGLRCSGTNYLNSLVIKNYRDVQIVSFLGHKHLWQAELKSRRKKPDIVIVISRNPYDWLRSIHREPHHCPDLIGKSFSTFLRSPWRAYLGKQWNHPSRSVRNAIKTKENLHEYFDSVIAMRNAKNAIFCSLKNTYENCVCIDLNALQQAPEQTLSFLTDRFGIELIGKFQNTKKFKKTDTAYKPKERVKISSSNLKHIHSHLDWEAESQLSHEKESYSYDNLFPWYRYKFLLRQFKNSLL